MLGGIRRNSREGAKEATRTALLSMSCARAEIWLRRTGWR